MRRWLACIALLALASPAAALEIVAPYALTSVEGNVGLSGSFTGGDGPGRYQQLYGANEFAALGGPILINAIAFRPDAQNAYPYTLTVPHVQINLSTSNKTVATLSNQFVHNVGVDDTIVFDSRALTLSTAFTGPVSGPKDFDIVVPLETSFLYDPAFGSLLLDVRVYDGGLFGFPSLDGHLVSTDGVTAVGSDDVNSASGGIETSGFVTRFSYTVVPEPASALLLGAGLTALAAIRRR